MDFIVGLPGSRGYLVILVVVDRLTKYAHFGALPTHYMTAKVAQLFVDIVVKLHGYPSSIISDRDTVFISVFWRKLYELSGTKLKHSTTYYLQIDGQTEVVNRGLEQYLRAFASTKPSSWFQLPSWAEFGYNSHHHDWLKMSPFRALYGREPPFIPAYVPATRKVQSLDELLIERDELLQTLKKNLLMQADRKRRKVEFVLGDWVWLKLQQYRKHSVANRSSNKLSLR